MNVSLFIWMVLSVGVAWVVGVYGRLNRMREQVIRARSSLLKHSGNYQAAASQLRAHSRMDIAGDTHGSQQPSSALLEALLTSVDELQVLQLRWETSPSPHVIPAGLGAAYDAVQLSVEQCAQAPEDLAGALWPTEERARWVELVQDIHMRRIRYNVHVAELNEAVSQMPAALLARFLGVREWGVV